MPDGGGLRRRARRDGGTGRAVSGGLSSGSTSARARSRPPSSTRTAAMSPTAASRRRGASVDTGAELDPGAVLASTLKAVRGAGSAPVAAIGVASMAETGVLLDRSGAPVVPRSPGMTAAAPPRRRPRRAPRRGCVRRPRRRAADRRPARWSSTAGCAATGRPPIAASAGSTSRSGSCSAWAVTRRPSSRSRPGPASTTSAPAVHGPRRSLGRTRRPACCRCGPRRHADGARGHRLGGAVLTVGGHDHLAGAVGAGAAETATCWTHAVRPRRSSRPPPRCRARRSAGQCERAQVGWHAIEGRHAVSPA